MICFDYIIILNAKRGCKCFVDIVFCCCLCFNRAETPPTLSDFDHRWSFKSGTENISVTVNPSRFIGQITLLVKFLSVCVIMIFINFISCLSPAFYIAAVVLFGYVSIFCGVGSK